MAFPDDRLNIKVELAIDSVWTDVTSYVYRDEITIVRGSADETGANQPAECRMLFNNRDGRFSPRNPNSPYYGNLGRNQDILVSVLDGYRYLDIPGSGAATTPDAAALDITGDIDVRFDATLEDWTASVNPNQTTIELMGKYLISGNQRSWLLQIDDGEVRFRWSANGTSTLESSSTVNISPDATKRLAIRATLDVDNGASGNTVTFYTAPTISGPWEQLGDPVVKSGTTSIFNSTATLRVGDAGADLGFATPYGKIHAAEVYNGISGTVVANPDFSVPAKGATSWSDAAGRTWTTTASGAGSINNQQNRFRGKVTAWPSRWEEGAFDVWVPIDAKGDMRRLNQGQKALQSTLRRRIPSDSTILAYWPMEDGEAATAGSSAVSGVAAIRYQGDIDPAAHAGPEGSDSLPSFNAGCYWFGSIPGPATSANAWQVEWLVNVQQTTATRRTIMYLGSSGTLITWRFLVSNGTITIRGYNRSGTAVVDQDVAISATDLINTWARWRFKLAQNGANCDWDIDYIPVGGAGGSFSGSYAGSVGRVSSLSGPEDGLSSDIEGLSWGHFAAFNTSETLIFNSADTGFAGESGWDRAKRIADEQGESLFLVGEPDEGSVGDGQPRMGAQRPDRFVDLIQECTDADHGFLGEAREANTGLVYISKSALYNQTPRLILGYEDDGEVHAPLDPTDDDLYVRNSVTATRERGGSTLVELATGPLSIDDIGFYDTEVEFNVEDDSALIHHAGWELHLNTWDEERYPTVLVKLEAAPGLISDAIRIDQGARIRITNARDESTRTHIPPGDIDLMVLGYTETISQFEWNLEFNCVPARPWDINVLDHLSNRTNRIDTDGCQVEEALDTTETGVTVLTTALDPRTGEPVTWTDEVENMPFDVTVGGEVMSVVAPGVLFNSNAFFDANTTGWTGSNASIARDTSVVHPDPRALASLHVTPNGVSATGGADSDRSGANINPGGVYRVSGWFYTPSGWSDIRPVVSWWTSGDVFISSSLGSASAVPAGVWTYIEQDVTAPSTAAKVSASSYHTGTPAATDDYYVWALRASRRTSSWIHDQFGRTLTDSWGTTDTKDTWTNSGGAGADYDTNGTYGSHTLTTTNVSRRSVTASPSESFDLYVDVAPSAVATGGSIFGGPQARSLDADNLYQARLEFTTGSGVILSVRERVAAVETQLGTFTTDQGGYTAGAFWTVRFKGSGTSLKAKTWPQGFPEPDVWQIEVTDSSLTTAGAIGVRSILASANTNVNPQVRYDNFELTNPQSLEVERSRNGVVKSHSTGAAISLTYPMHLAL